MSTQRGMLTYRCAQDCRFEGCPGHEMVMELGGADTVRVTVDGNELMTADRAVVEAIYYMVHGVPSMSGLKREAHRVS